MASRFAGARDLAATILFWFVIVVGICAVIWFIISCIGNCTNFGEPTAPDIGKAKYEVFIKANGRVIYTDEYTNDTPGVYILHGYYEFADNNFRWHKDDLRIDTYYYGPVEIKVRVDE